MVCECLRGARRRKRTHPRSPQSKSLCRPLACEGPNTTTSSLGSVGNLGFPSIVSFRSHPYPYPNPGPPQRVFTNWPGRRPGSASTSNFVAERPHDGGRVSAAAARSTKTSPVPRRLVIISLPSTTSLDLPTTARHQVHAFALRPALHRLTLLHHHFAPPASYSINHQQHQPQCLSQ